MAADQHKLSRRALLAGACVAPLLPRHSGLDPRSMNTAATPYPPSVSMDPGLRRDDERWQKASARYARAIAGLEAVAHTEEDDVYDRALDRHSAALARLLRTRAPDLAAVSRKLDLILRHSVFELNYAEPCLAALQRDVRRFAGC